MAAEHKEAMEQEKGSEKTTELEQTAKSKFLPFGKYFLLLLVLTGQAYLAYTAVDKNYEKIYEFLNRIDEDDYGTYKLEELVVNPAETNGQRYLLTEISLQLHNNEDVKRVEENKMKIRQEMIDALSARTVDQLIRKRDREVLRKELASIINNALGNHSVRNLYFTKYVMQ